MFIFSHFLPIFSSGYYTAIAEVTLIQWNCLFLTITCNKNTGVRNGLQYPNDVIPFRGSREDVFHPVSRIFLF